MSARDPMRTLSIVREKGYFVTGVFRAGSGKARIDHVAEADSLCRVCLLVTAGPVRHGSGGGTPTVVSSAGRRQLCQRWLCLLRCRYICGSSVTARGCQSGNARSGILLCAGAGRLR